MATYYVRKTGNDSNAGTSAGAAWLTIGKALGASGIASGDTVYIGAGVYRETITVNMTSATVETKVIGDVDGVQTGDAGEVIITSYTTNDRTTPSSSRLIDLNSRDFLTFQNLLFISGANVIVQTSAGLSTDIKFTKCTFTPGAGSATLNIVSTADNALNWTIDSCIFLQNASSPIALTLVRPSAADFNVNVVVKNCLFIGASTTTVAISSSGANTFKAGGVSIYNCTKIAGGIFVNIADANISTTIPINVYNCLIYTSQVPLVANLAGQIVEDYNNFSMSSSNTNVTLGAHSVNASLYSPSFSVGHESLSIGSNIVPFGFPKLYSPNLGFGNQGGSPSVDILGSNRPSGSIVSCINGTATAGAAKTLTDSTKILGTNVYAGCTIKIISGTGSGQTKSISSNTATVVTVDGNWKTNPDNTSVYEIYAGAPSSSGTATAGSTTTLTDANAAWGTNMWTGYTLKIDGGTGSPQSLIVVSNTATVITFATATAPDATSTYKLFRGTDENTINAGIGCYEKGNSTIQDTTNVRIGSNSLKLPGAGYQDFKVPVDVGNVTVSVYSLYDSNYSGTLPSLNIINGTECGVANATATQVGAANTWEQLSLTFVPTAKGIITVRLISNSTTPTGNAYFSDFYGFDYYRRGQVLNGFALLKKVIGFNRFSRRLNKNKRNIYQ